MFPLHWFLLKKWMKKHRRGRYIKNNHIIECTSIYSKFLWSVSWVFYMNCSKYLQLSDRVNQKAWFHFKWYSWFYKGSWTLLWRTLQRTSQTLCCVSHCQLEEINQLFSVVFGDMKQDRLIFNLTCYEWNWLALHVKAMKYLRTVWGTQHAFYMKITEKIQRNCRKIRCI